MRALFIFIFVAFTVSIGAQSVAEVKLRKVLDYIRESGQKKLDAIMASTSPETQAVGAQIFVAIDNSSLNPDQIKSKVTSLYSSSSPEVRAQLDGVYGRLKEVLSSWVQGKKGAGMLWETTTSLPTTTGI